MGDYAAWKGVDDIPGIDVGVFDWFGVGQREPAALTGPVVLAVIPTFISIAYISKSHTKSPWKSYRM